MIKFKRMNLSYWPYMMMPIDFDSPDAYLSSLNLRKEIRVKIQ